MLGPGGRGKKRTKLEKLLRQDHSDVYFDNDRLNDQLNLHIECMQKELYRHDLQRNVEISKLRQEVTELKALLRSNREDEARDLEQRPHTSVGHSTQRRAATAGLRKRAQSAWARTSDTASPQITLKADDEVKLSPERSPSPSSSISTLKNTVTLRKYQHIGANSFKENGRFPEEWYHRCLPASDAAIHNARKKIRGKFAPPIFDFLGKIREREIMEKKLEAYSMANKKLVADKNNGNGNDEEIQGMNLICEEPVKPVLMSRRRLMEISNAENLVDRGPSRNTLRKQNIKELNAIEYKRIEDKVHDFCEMLEELKMKELVAMKEREEALRQEALERQLKAIEAEKELENQKQAEKKDDDDDDRRFRNRRK